MTMPHLPLRRLAPAALTLGALAIVVGGGGGGGSSTGGTTSTTSANGTTQA